MADPTYGEPSGQEPEYDSMQDSTEQSEGVDPGTNEDLHGQAREVADSAKGPGAAETPAG
jgi:hypothetical protein